MSYIGNEPIVSATRTITEITATAGQTVFVANGGYTVGYIDVFVNGAQLQTSDFTATNGSSITLSQAAQSGDDIRLVAWGTFQTSGAVQKAGDTMSGNLAVPSLQIGGQGVSGHYGMKNRIINGAMMIDQRNAGASITPTTSGDWWGCDRWRFFVNGASSKFSTQQSSVAPSGFSNSTLITSLSAYNVASTENLTLAQIIEGFNTSDLNFGTASAQPVTISFWVRSSLTGTFGGSLANSASDRSYPFSYTISAANTWEQKSITIAGDTTGTWIGATNGAGLRVRFNIGSGSNFLGTANAWAAGNILAPTGSTSIVATNGATFYITGVQLEKGSTATSFDYRPYGTELALCQRYFELKAFCVTVNGASQVSATMHYAVTKRAVPTITRTGNYNSGSEAGTAVSVNNSLNESHWFNTTVAAGGTFTVSAEL